MSVATAPSRSRGRGRLAIARRARLRVAARSEGVVIGGLVLWTLALAAVTWGRWGDLTMDTGYDLLAASRTAGGELPYADYVYFYGPLGPLLLGGIYALTGPAVWPAVALGLVLAALAIGLTYRLARHFAAPLPAGLAAALVAVAALSSANNSYVLPHSTSAPLATVLALAAILALAGAATRRRLGLAGVLCGLAAVTRPELALALLAAVTAWLGVQVLQAGAGRRRAAWLDAATVLGPALAVPALVYGAFLTRVSLHDLLLENLYPIDFVRAAGHVVLDAHAPLTVASVAELAGRLAVYAAGAAALVALGRLAVGRPRLGRALQLAVPVALGAVAIAVLARPESVRFYLQWAYAWIPAGAWLAVLYLLWRRRGVADHTPLLVALFLGAVTLNTYASFLPFPNAEFPEATPYVLPLAAAFLVWLHIDELGGRAPGARLLGAAWLAALVLAAGGLAAHDARQETATVRGPHGAMAALPQEAPALQRALDLVAAHSRPGDPVFIAPQLTALYVMAGRRDPLPQLSLLPGALATAADEDRAIARLRGVRVAVVDRTPLRTYHHGAFGTTFDRRLDSRLRRDFRRLETTSGPGAAGRQIDVWIRR